MSAKSTKDRQFLGTLENWLKDQSEILILLRYSRTAGNKSFEFFTSFPELVERLHSLNPETAVTAFRQPQLSIRGVVDDEFITECVQRIHDGSEFLIVGMRSPTTDKKSSPGHEAGESHLELRQALEELRGEQVAAGEYPPWREESPQVISAYVPDERGQIRLGCY